MDDLTLTCLKSKDLIGCVGFKPEIISQHGSPKAACVSATLNFLGLQNNQYSVGTALGNIMPDRSEFLGVWIYGRRKGARVSCNRNIPAVAFKGWAGKRVVVYTDHHHQGTWRAFVGYEPVVDALLFYDPVSPSLWSAVPSGYHDKNRAPDDIAVTFMLSKTGKKYPDDWLPPQRRCDLWHAEDWVHNSEYARKWWTEVGSRRRDLRRAQTA